MSKKNHVLKKSKKHILIYLAITVLCTSLLLLESPFYQETSLKAYAETADNIVISEMQLSGNKASDEFIELYNPTPNPINLELLPLKLHIRNSSGKDQNKTLTFYNAIIPAYGFYLIAPASTAYSGQADATYSKYGNMLVSNGGLYISTNKLKDTDVIDKVGFGAQPVGGYEKNPFANNPIKNQSVERKANEDSTSETMRSGGIDESKGNAWDTDNNSNDFLLKTNPWPQNSKSEIENYNPAIINIVNQSFEIDANANNLPDNWYYYNFTQEDGRSVDYHKEGNYSLKITGDISKPKYIGQKIQEGGIAGETLTLSGWNKTEGAISNGMCIRAFIRLNYMDGSRKYKSFAFKKETHDWTYNSVNIAADKDYSSINIYIGYFYQAGVAYFDDFKLIKQ